MCRWPPVYPASTAAWPEAAACCGGLAEAGAGRTQPTAAAGGSGTRSSRAAARADACCAQQDPHDAQQAPGFLQVKGVGMWGCGGFTDVESAFSPHCIACSRTCGVQCRRAGVGQFGIEEYLSPELPGGLVAVDIGPSLGTLLQAAALLCFAFDPAYA